VAAGSTRRIMVVFLLCLGWGGWGCSHLDAQPDEFRLMEKEAAAQQLLSKILRECTVAAGRSVCRRTLPDFCTAVVKVEGASYRCPSPEL